MACPKILVFDSGAGALSITEEILRKLPKCHLVCAVDNAYFPYGLKGDVELTKRIVNQVEHLHCVFSPDIVVIACNTASTLVLDILRKEFSNPFVGVVPAIKPAANITSTGSIGVLATPATIARQYTQNLVKDFARRHKVILHGSNKLVAIAEDKIYQRKIPNTLLAEELDSLLLRDATIDTLVLACTHFPLLKQEMQSYFASQGRKITLVDSGAAIANRVCFLAERHAAPGDRAAPVQHHRLQFCFSDNSHSNDLETYYRHHLGNAI